MKHTVFRCTMRLAAMLAAALTASASMLPVSAAETAKPDAPQEIVSVVPDYEPLSGDTFTLNTVPDIPMQVEIYQHSPERANLLLFQNDFTPAADELGASRRYRMEPGDYTVKITYSAVSSSKSNNRTLEYNFAIDNADYSKAPELHTRTDYVMNVACEMLEGTDSAEPKALAAQPAYRNGIKTETVSAEIGIYACHRGDYDNNGETDVMDAQSVLREYVENYAGNTDRPDAANAMQTAVCDIDGDGELTAIDSQYILIFYTDAFAGLTPKWPDGAADLRFSTAKT